MPNDNSPGWEKNISDKLKNILKIFGNGVKVVAEGTKNLIMDIDSTFYTLNNQINQFLEKVSIMRSYKSFIINDSYDDMLKKTKNIYLEFTKNNGRKGEDLEKFFFDYKSALEDYIKDKKKKTRMSKLKEKREKIVKEIIELIGNKEKSGILLTLKPAGLNENEQKKILNSIMPDTGFIKREKIAGIKKGMVVYTDRFQLAGIPYEPMLVLRNVTNITETDLTFPRGWSVYQVADIDINLGAKVAEISAYVSIPNVGFGGNVQKIITLSNKLKQGDCKLIMTSSNSNGTKQLGESDK